MAQAPDSVREFRIDFPYTDPNEHKLTTWIFESENKSGNPLLTEAGVVDGLSAVVNSGGITMLSVSVMFTEDGYISGAKAVSVDTPNPVVSPIRIAIVYHDMRSNEFTAPSYVQRFLPLLIEANENRRAYEIFTVPRGQGTGIQTMIMFFCTQEPCPGKYSMNPHK